MTDKVAIDDWLDYFTSYFEEHEDSVSMILDARGCREGWLQGELFLYAIKYFGEEEVVTTNDSKHKYDLFSDKKSMATEIKICGGDYQLKVKGLIKADIAKLKKNPLNFNNLFFLFLIDRRYPDTILGHWLKRGYLDEQEFAGHDKAELFKSDKFRVDAWKIRK